MFKNPDFHAELNSPLFGRNLNHYISSDMKESEIDKIQDKISRLLDQITNDDMPSILNTDIDEFNNPELERIFKLDAQRTFVTDCYKDLLFENLKFICLLLVDTVDPPCQNYHQGLGYVVSLGSVIFNNQNLLGKFLHFVGNSSKHSKNYFIAEPSTFVGHANFLNEVLLPKYAIEASDLLKRFYIVPQMFMTKIFIGLGVHYLPINLWLDFITNYLTFGRVYLYSFTICLLNRLCKYNKHCQNISSFLSLIRLEDERADWKLPDFIKLDFFDNLVSDEAVDFIQVLRNDGYDDEHLWELEKEHVDIVILKVEEAKARLAQVDSDDEIVFSDEEDDD